MKSKEKKQSILVQLPLRRRHRHLNWINKTWNTRWLWVHNKIRGRELNLLVTWYIWVGAVSLHFEWSGQQVYIVNLINSMCKVTSLLLIRDNTVVLAQLKKVTLDFYQRSSVTFQVSWFIYFHAPCLARTSHDVFYFPHRWFRKGR